MNLFHNYERLNSAYNCNFIGQSVNHFLEYLKKADVDNKEIDPLPLYAKAVMVVQSSGTGTGDTKYHYVGRHIFTLPICLRRSADPGYPPGDKPVVEYLSNLMLSNLVDGDDFSESPHMIGLACFDCAAKMVMLEWLQTARGEDGNELDGLQLLAYWHGVMEPTGARDRRQTFFQEVVRRADLMKQAFDGGEKNLKRNSEPKLTGTFAPSRRLYDSITKKANDDLWKFLGHTFPFQKTFVMYFDEASELAFLGSIFLRLVQHQEPSVKMWYVFMGTKSIFGYGSPRYSQISGLRDLREVAQLLPPYINLGFDQQAIINDGAPVSIRMGQMQTITFLAQYGRPLWKAHLQDNPIHLASQKLLNGADFNAENEHHVFAVLSQRLCLEPTLEATELASRSVEHHMRLFSNLPKSSPGRFHTYSPSEPILVLGSINILYNTPYKLLPTFLGTLSNGLCRAGLVEKGILGELGACTLLLIARDFAAPLGSDGRDLLTSVPLLKFVYKLFSKKSFHAEKRKKFKKAFGEAYVNFTHWILTQDSFCDEPDWPLLANLWARGGGLQYCFSQETIELLIPVYIESVAPDSQFEPSRLSAVLVQVKNKIAADKTAKNAMHPIGIPRDLQHPLPYLALLMDLGGGESFYQEKIVCEASETPADGEYMELCAEWEAAVKELESYRRKGKIKREKLKKLKKAVNDARHARDSCNLFSISARGISRDVYGILRKADIASEFQTLMDIIMPWPSEECDTIKHMRPLERLGAESGHAAWMMEFEVLHDKL